MAKKQSNQSLIILCAMLIAKYEQTCLQELNVLSKHFQIENVDLSQLGAHIELTTRSLTRMF
jgi:hypothetical protein